MSLYAENDSLLDKLENKEGEIEQIKLDGVESADEGTKKRLALEVKTIVSRLVANIADSGGDANALGGALVLADLIEVLKRYREIFDIPGLAEQLDSLEQMWQESK